MDLGTPIATKVVGAVSLLVLAALGWALVVGPETATLSETRAEIEITRDQNGVLALQLAQLEKQREQLGDTRRTARELATQFPPTADQPGLFEAVTTAAVEAGIGAQGLTTLAPSPPLLGEADAAGTTPDPAAGGASRLARQTVSVSVAGTYDETQRLLANLEHMPRAYLVTSVTLASDGDAGYTTTISGEMFVMPPVDDPGQTINLSATTDD
jgi:Tfp pilus assembly protein PilO